MKRACDLYSVLTLSFILILSASGSLTGALSDLVYVLAFALPLFIGLAVARGLKREREEERGCAELSDTRLLLRGGEWLDLLIAIAPTVSAVLLVSYLSSLLLGLFGAPPEPLPDGTLAEMLLVYALLPSVLEEMLFRYLPMKLIAPYSKKWCIILSSLFFAIIHGSFFKMPYAFVAGAIFIVMDLAASSPLPSVIVHLVNNVISVIWIKYAVIPVFAEWLLSSLGVLSLLSLGLVYLRRERFKRYAERALTSDASRVELGRCYLIVCVLGLFLGAISTFT